MLLHLKDRIDRIDMFDEIFTSKKMRSHKAAQLWDTVILCSQIRVM